MESKTFKCKRCGADGRNGVQCSQCQGHFDFTCSGITEAGYRKLGERKATWKCASCKGIANPLVLPGITDPAASSPVFTDMESIALDIKRLSSQMTSLPTLMTSVKAIQADIADLKTMKTDIAEMKLLKPEMENVKVSLEFMQGSVETLNIRILEISKEVQGLLKIKDKFQVLQERFEQLESNMRDFDQRSRLNNIEIKGVPVSNTENLFDIVAKIGNHISCPIPKEQINYVARIPMRNDKHNKNIIISIHNKYIKEDFVAASKKFTIVPADLGLRGDKRIYVNDHLTQENKMLLTKAKAISKERGFAFIWVKGCKIYVRKNTTSHVLTIRTESDLKKIV